MPSAKYTLLATGAVLGVAAGIFLSSPGAIRAIEPAASAQLSPGPIPAPHTVCYNFTTVDIGDQSLFGYFCNDFFENRFSPSGGPSPCYADVAHPAFEGIFRDACTFESFWVQHSTAPVPVIDFSKDYVIAVVAGLKPSGCYGIEITSIAPVDCGTKIFIRERIPCTPEYCSRALTNPFHIVRICKKLLPWETPTCFEHRRDQNPGCNLFLECAEVIDE